jgi:microcystin-dependent protein
MPNPLPYPNFQALDANGDPYSGGKLYTYTAGTTTPKAAYTDSALSVEADNPVILDSRGEAVIYLSGSYKLVLKDSDDVTIWTVDGVSSLPTTDGNEEANDFAKFTSAGVLTGRSYAEVKADLDLEIGVDVLAQQTIGIADDNLVEIDGDPGDGEYAQFTENGLKGLTGAELLAALGATATVPTGTVIIWPMETPPSGYLVCDGSAVSRTTYEDLWTLLGTTYGSGNGSTTFNLPNFMGRFIRGWDNGEGNDPDAGDREDRGDGNDGDIVGTLQDWAMKDHWHQYYYSSMNLGSGGTGLIITVGAGNNLPQTGKDAVRQAHEAEVGGSNISNVSSESRPINISMNFCIKT